MNETRITVHGNVVSEPVERQGRNGSVFTTFRVATTPYRRLPDGRFIDGDTSFYSVIAFNALAANVAAVVRKGHPVVIEGKLAIKQYVDSDGQTRTSPEIDADHVGHDLSWGRSRFERVSKAAALGHDRTADPHVRAEMLAMTESADTQQRPPHVDANGVVSNDYDPGPGLAGPDDAVVGSSAEPGGPADGLGDPETDDYEVVDRASA
ncbi:single-stranded DNA-binding protein [Monashia sp. NPDC004114]